MKKYLSKKSLVIFISLLSIIVAMLLTCVFLFNNDDKVTSIYISKLPTSLEYSIGEELNLEGIVIKGEYDNKKQITINIEDCTISGFDSSKESENVNIIIEYDGLMCSFCVSIKKNVVANRLLKSIEIATQPTKQIYKMGEDLDVTGGLILCHYDDNSTEIIPLLAKYIYGYTEEVRQTAKVHTLTVKYVENGILAETTFTITVTE